MSTQPEAILESKLIKQLKGLKYDRVLISDEDALRANLKAQLEIFNSTTFSDKEFSAIINHLSKGNVFQKAKTLRDRFCLRCDNETNFYVRFYDSDNWDNNLLQVTSQVTVEGKYRNRYDVTLLFNGLPLVQIELKRRGLELKKAFNQINRYQRHSYAANSALFQYIQVFVISNGVNTRYYANNKKQSFKQTFFWADIKNRNIKELTAFTDAFLKPDHIGKMIAHYVVFNETYKILMVLRPYQYYATEKVIDKVHKNSGNGYIWHTTGSGKTLTSFKASQVIMDLPEVEKVVFVVDRKDLDYQTMKEFNSFKKDCVDVTDNTRSLVKQFGDETKLIVTTIQKLNNAVSKKRYETKMAHLQNKRMVFIFDECHRSQFGTTHKNITGFFNKIQMFGFTGTPIFAKNATKNEHGKRTTKELFGERLHEYVICDAIRDENVLKFSVEYLGKYKKAGKLVEDTKVEGIDTREYYEDDKRLEKIVNYIIKYHNGKTHKRQYSAIFAVSNIPTLIKYYGKFKEKIKAGQTDLRIATIFSYEMNEESKEANGHLPGDEKQKESESEKNKKHSREKLDEYIADYNAMYGTKFSTKDNKEFENYFKDISKRLKEREKEDFQDKNRLDILLVVDMFLTGFDAKKLNTLYVDKNLHYHGLVQAFSRTNRVINEQKSQGNILSFRYIKENTDEAIALFSNKQPTEDIYTPPYDEMVEKFAKAYLNLLAITPTVKSVDRLESEDDELAFVQAFRELMRIKNVLTCFTVFNWDNLAANEQIFEDYKSKYLDLYDKVKLNRTVNKESVLEDIDFEVELIGRDDINVAYILKLLAKLKNADPKDVESQRKAIMGMLAGDVEYRSKRELIEKFIEEQLPNIKDVDDIPDEFAKYWQDQKVLALGKLCEEEHLDQEQFKALIEAYIYSEHEPLREDVYKCLDDRPSPLKAAAIAKNIINKMKQFVDVFIKGMVA